MKAFILIFCLLGSSYALSKNDYQPDLGEIDFQVKASPEYNQTLQKGILALHAFWYSMAKKSFQELQKMDPDKFWGYWGEIQSYYHPLWGEGNREQAKKILLKFGQSAEKRMERAQTEKEKAYLKAIEALIFKGYKNYEKKMRKLAKKFPEDPEAKAFHALSLVSVANPGKRGYRKRGFDRLKEAGEVAKEVLKENPAHPGALHYLIHAYDDPALAAMAGPYLDDLVGAAPGSPHLQHMPSHIYLRLGKWDEVIKFNQQAFDVSQVYVKAKDEPLYNRDFHSAEFLHYALLQAGRDKEALQWVKLMEKTYEESGQKHHLIRSRLMQSRQIVETQDWTEKTLPELIDYPHYQWMNQANAATLLAHGLGSAEMNEIEKAEKIIKLAETWKDKNRKNSYPYLSKLMEIVGLQIRGALAFKKNSGKGLSLLAQAFKIEEDLNPPVYGPPHPIKPSCELYAQKLIEVKKYDMAKIPLESCQNNLPERRGTLKALDTIKINSSSEAAEGISAAEIEQLPVADKSAEESDVIGEVSFPVSCNSSVQPAFNDAVATLHSFEFAEARRMFEEIADREPDCAMAYWGLAETYYYPLWAPPSPGNLAAGAAAVQKAQNREKTTREALYVDAIAAFYHDYENVSHRVRAQRYEEAMARAHKQLPDDPEAGIFYALAMLSNVDPTDKTYTVQKEVGLMLKPLFEKMPNHPGIVHYIIHAYDYPALADRAKQAAYRYLDIAASMPHALHMSGHIFTQLGMWEESIEANARSAQAARDRGKHAADDSQAQLNEIHALDYLVYAHLQRGDNEQAQRIVEQVRTRDDLDWSNWVVAYNAGAIPVRWVLERHAWEEAASIPSLASKVGEATGYTGQMTIALRHWAAALGAARNGQLDKAEGQLARLEDIAASLQDSDEVWARNTSEVLRREAAAWLSLAKGDEDQALALMRSAVALEDETDKSSLSPGRPVPSHEMLGDMLMQLGRPEQALAEYQTSLGNAPRRYNSFLGAARAASEAGRPRVAAQYYEKLLDLAVTDSARPGVEEARDYLKRMVRSGLGRAPAHVPGIQARAVSNRFSIRSRACSACVR